MNKQLGDSMTSRQFISASLSTSEFAEPILEDDFLERVRTETASLLSEIEKSDLRRAERVHLLNLLDLMHNAVIDADVGGAASLHAAASEVLGILITEHTVAGPSPFRGRVGDFAWGVASSVVAQGLVIAHRRFSRDSRRSSRHSLARNRSRRLIVLIRQTCTVSWSETETDLSSPDCEAGAIPIAACVDENCINRSTQP